MTNLIANELHNKGFKVNVVGNEVHVTLSNRKPSKIEVILALDSVFEADFNVVTGNQAIIVKA